MSEIPSVVLHTGTKIPQIALGTYLLKGDSANAIVQALKLGYRHIDTAAFYQNQQEIGKIIKECGIPRQELFITSKVWFTNMTREKSRKSVQKSLSDLGLEYLDLILIHWPRVEGVDPKDGKTLEAARLQVWETFIQLKKEGKVKDIGVSNFFKKHLQPLLKTSQKPVVNQIKLNPYFVLEEQVQFCRKHNILIESWSPLAHGKSDLLLEPLIKNLSQKYNCTAAQICLRWNLQHGHIILPKTATKSRLQQNMSIFNFVLTQDEMKQIDCLTTLGKDQPQSLMMVQ